MNEDKKKPETVEEYCAEHFWTRGLSLDESRVSAVIISFLVFLMLSVFLYLTVGDIPSSLQSIINTLILAISGVNAVDTVFGKDRGQGALTDDDYDNRFK